MNHRISKAIGAVALAVICMTPVASKAAPIIDLLVEKGDITTGSVFYAGGATSMAGSAIDVEFVTSMDTPSNTLSTFYVDEGFLSFKTGNLVNFNAGSSTWLFGPGGSISATGSIPEIFGNNNTMGLLQGTLGRVSVTKSGTAFMLTADSFFDRKAPLLAAEFGMLGGFNPGDPLWRGILNLSFNGSGTTGGGFASTLITGGDVKNTPVPEPGTMALLASGLVGLVSFRKKR